MVVDGVPPSRRGFLAGAVAAAGGLITTGCGSASVTAGSPTIPQQAPHPGAARRGDAAILLAALAMERQTIATYAACIPLLSHADARWAQAFVIDENQQAGSLLKLIKLCGAKAPMLGALPRIGHPGDGAQALALLQALEREQVARYLQWIPRLSAGTLRASVAAIVAADAQHLGALRCARGQPALTSAFVLQDGPGTAA